MRDDLILLNEQLHEEADDILDKKGLRKILDRYGILHVTGSYSLGLMTWRDLDIYLEAEGLAEQEFFELGKDIDSLLRPVKMSFRNERIAKRITPESKMKILEIKSVCWTDPLYRKFYTSNDIYTAVLEKHAHDVESFRIYLQNKLSV